MKYRYTISLSEKEVDIFYKLLMFGSQMASYITAKVDYLRSEKTQNETNTYSANEAITSATIWRESIASMNKVLSKIKVTPLKKRG